MELTVKEAAAYPDPPVSTARIIQLINKGNGPLKATKSRYGRGWIIKIEDLQAVLPLPGQGMRGIKKPRKKNSN